MMTLIQHDSQFIVMKRHSWQMRHRIRCPHWTLLGVRLVRLVDNPIPPSHWHLVGTWFYSGITTVVCVLLREKNVIAIIGWCMDSHDHTGSWLIGPINCGWDMWTCHPFNIYVKMFVSTFWHKKTNEFKCKTSTYCFHLEIYIRWDIVFYLILTFSLSI